MTSSGMKRGLAITAVSALAATGLPLFASTAYARPLASEFTSPNSVVLYNPDGVGSLKNDGTNTSVTLLAGAGSNVTSVDFRSSSDAGVTWIPIATVSPDTNGAYGTEWSPAAGSYLVEAIGRDSGGNVVDTYQDTIDVSATDDSVNVGNAKGSRLGVFQQPYNAGGAGDGANDATENDLGIVSATTSDVTGDSGVEFYGVDVVGAGDAYGNYGNTGTTEDDTPAVGATTRTTRGLVDFDGYNWGTALDDDQAVVEAFMSSEDDSSETVDVYVQAIDNVTVTTADNNIPTGDTTTNTVTVLDQEGDPVAGAQVVDEADLDGAGKYDNYTNTLGQYTFTGVTGSPTGTGYAYYVNVDDRDAYNNGDDFRVTTTVTEYTPAATTITPASEDGSAFDVDENATGDITVAVEDQQGEPLAGEVVRYYWTINPFDATVDDVTTVEQTTAATDGDGMANVVFPTGQPDGTYTLHSYINRDDIPGQQAADLGGQDLTVKAGESDIVWEDDPSAQRPSGTTQVFDGSLELADGTTLGDRSLDVDWNNSDNAIVALQPSQPAGTTRTSDTHADVVTGADGSFSVALSDPDPAPAGGEPSELNGILTATGVAGADEVGVDATEDLDVDFLDSLVPASIEISTDQLFFWATPGRPVSVSADVENASGNDLANQEVQISVDHGSLTPFAANRSELTPAPAAAVGGLYGEWASLGTSETETTDEDGDTNNTVNIERDAGFDDNGMVTTTVTVTAGAITETQEITFHSGDTFDGSVTPLNPASVSVQLAPQSEQDVDIVNATGKAPTSEEVFYDVFAKDQYGNLVRDEVDISDDSLVADFDEWGYSQFTTDGPGIDAFSDGATVQRLTADWEADQNLWVDDDPGPLVDLNRDYIYNPKTVTDTSGALTWYVINYANSTFTLDQQGPEIRRVGATVTEVYTARDQNGEPIEDIFVDFFRAGPDNLQDGDGNSGDYTGSNGKAFYVFQGAKAGTARITAVPYFEGDRIPGATRNDTVRFKHVITANLRLGNQRDGDDIARVSTDPNSAGALVKLYKVRADGSLNRIRTSHLNSNGNRNFVINDTRPRRFTKYVARVFATATKFGDWTPKRRIR